MRRFGFKNLQRFRLPGQLAITPRNRRIRIKISNNIAIAKLRDLGAAAAPGIIPMIYPPCHTVFCKFLNFTIQQNAVRQ